MTWQGDKFSGFLSEILHEKGHVSFAIGKWRLVPALRSD